MTNILYAVAVLGSLGAIFGLVLAVASKKFAVKVDEREAEILAALPGANCGGCGYPGCAGYAAAIVKGEAEPGRCTPGGSESAAKIGKIMGVEAVESKRAVALVKCSGFTGHVRKKFDYSGLDDCVAAMRLGGGQGPNECPHGCIGFGTCVKVCPFDAIHLQGGIARVDSEKCTGCMLCAASCPKHVIVKVPYEADITVACNSTQKGAVLRKYCDIGCLGCKICERSCQYDAIHVVDNLAQIDYDKCVSCGQCVAKCPRGLIRDGRLNKEGDEPTPPAVSRYAD
jgi:Na+-translocating ferredoxin:NAD+ oxidoreductase RNF subunit RnfB